jgi:hypothetical protein
MLRDLWLWWKREVALALAKDWMPVPHEAFRHDEERALALRMRQEAARQSMERAGVKTLLNGAPGYWKIVDMSAPADVKKVVRMRGKR